MSNRNINHAIESFAPSAEQKERIYRSIASARERGKQQAKLRLKVVFLCCAAACLIVAATAAILLSGPTRQDNAALAEPGGVQTNKPATSGGVPTQAEPVFPGFVFTAYRPAGGAEYLSMNYVKEADQLTLTPDVKVLLSKYSLAMSSVPGLPFTVGLTGDDAENLIDTVNVSVDSGGLCEWDQNTGIVTSKGQVAEIDVGKTFYWSPVDGGGAADVIYVTITVEAVVGGDTVGRQEIVITQEEPGYYYATAGELETM